MHDPEVAHRYRWWTLAVLCLSLVLISIDNNILNVALPTLAKPADDGGVGATATQLQWIVDGYVIVFAGLLLTTGSLSDRFGRYRFLAAGLVLFGTGSTLSAFASSPDALIASRCLMGAAAACMMPSTLSILSNVFRDPMERRKAIGIWAGASAVGGSLGPVTGGALMSHFWWGSIFLVNAPVVVIALVGGYLIVPDSRDPSARNLDPLGALLSIAFLVALLWAIIEAPAKGWGSTPVLVAFGLGGLFLILFVVWEQRAQSPMLEIRFFENPRFSVASAAIMLTFLSMYGMVFLLTQYLQGVRGYSPVEAGAVLIPQGLIFFASASASPRLVHRLGGTRVIATGLGLLATAMVLMALLDASSSVYAVILVSMVTGVGIGQVMAPATDSIMGAVPRERAGVGSAMNDTTRQIGGALGIAVFGSILASRYGAVIGSSLGDLPGGLVDRVENSVSEARTVALTEDGRGYADRILSASSDAFLSGMRVAMLAAACVVAVAMFAVLRWLPARGHDEVVEETADPLLGTATGTGSG